MAPPFPPSAPRMCELSVAPSRSDPSRHALSFGRHTRLGLLVLVPLVGGIHNLGSSKVLISRGRLLFRSPSPLCRGGQEQGFVFAAAIARMNWRTAREDPAILSGTIGVFEVDRCTDDDPPLLTMDLREVIGEGRRIPVRDAHAQTDLPNIGLASGPDSVRTSRCIPANALFLGELRQDIRG